MDCEGFRERMLDVLYDEADAETERLVRQHSDQCPLCREELEGLQQVRGAIQAWALPRLRPAVRRFAPPRYFWAVAAAATLVLAVGGAVALSGLSLTLSRGPVALSVGRADAPEAITASAPLTETRPVFVPPTPATQVTRPVALPQAERQALLREMAEMIRQSEERQVVAMRTGLTQLEERAALQRRYDLARVSAGLAYLDGRTGQQMARTTELMGHVLQVSSGRER